MMYASYAEGYKGDGFTQRVFPPEPSLPYFEPEYVDSYEIGLKSDLLEGTMRINAAVFYSEYTDMQLLVADDTRLGPFTTNAGDATMKGAELEVNWIPAEGWRLDFGVGYLDADYDSLTDGAIAVGLTKSSPFTMVSEWNTYAALEKVLALTNASTLTPRVEWTWRDDFYTNTNGVPWYDYAKDSLFQPAYSLVNISMTWVSPSKTYSLRGGVDNVNDKEYRIYGEYNPAFGFDMEAFDRGRQWYVQASYEF